MKSFKNVFAILFVSVILCSCSNSGNGGASVVGTWNMNIDEQMKKVEAKGKGIILPSSHLEYVFNEDGTGMEQVVMITEQPAEEGVKFKVTATASNPFRWHKDGSRLDIKITDINMSYNWEAICDNPKKRAKWQKEAKRLTDSMNKDINIPSVKAETLAKVNSEGGYDFEILELSESKLELKSAKGDIKKFNKAK